MDKQVFKEALEHVLIANEIMHQYMIREHNCHTAAKEQIDAYFRVKDAVESLKKCTQGGDTK